MKETLMRQIIAKYKELVIDLLVGYYTPVTQTADKLQIEIATLNAQLKQAESEPKELVEIIEEEKCSRCKDISDELINWIKCV